MPRGGLKAGAARPGYRPEIQDVDGRGQGRSSEEKPGPRTPWQPGVLGQEIRKGDGNAELPRRREPASYGHDEREACGGSGRPDRIEADGPGACPDGRDGMRLFGEAPAPPRAIEPREKRWRRRLPVASA